VEVHVGFLAASTSITRYRIVEEVPQELWAEILDRLLRNVFKDIDEGAEERSFGWTCFDNMLDTAWQTAPPEKGEYLTFSLRLDTRRIPAAVLKKHCQIALEQALEHMKEQGKKFLSKEQKTEIKEQVTLRLRARTLPIPAYFDVVWDTSKNLVYLGTTQAKIQELFEELFSQTFDLNLEPQNPFFKALNLLGEERLKDLEEAESTVFV